MSARFDNQPLSVSAARHFVGDEAVWHGVHDRDVLGSAELIVSEFVTNAFAAGSPQADVSLQHGAGLLRIDVADTAFGVPVMRPMNPLSLRGRGLRLVDGLATGWGCAPTPTGKRVWATIFASGGRI